VKQWLAIGGLVVALIAAACGGDDDTASPTAQEPTAEGTAASTATPTVTEPPAGIVEAGAYTAEAVFPQLDFERMVEIEQIPGTDDAVVITQGGVAYRFSLLDESVDPSVFLDINSRLIDGPRNEEGLLGIAFDPDFASNSRYYIYYSAGPPRGTILERLVYAGPGADPVPFELLAIAQPFSNHNGGALEFGPDGYLYVGVGDGGSGGDRQGNGQNTDTILGNILRVDVSGDGAYSIPPGNPFADGGGVPEIFAYGFRNPWRFSFDTVTGTLWAGDVGQNELEEIDLVEIGGNYGWNIMEGDACFNAGECDRSGLVQPRAVYGRDEGCSVTGGYVYRGTEMPELDGWYVYGDYCTGNVWALDTTDETSDPVRIAETGLQIASFWQDAEGEIYLITFANRVLKLVR
jgi:glucose/arabinose dehydrogenase